MWVTRMAQKLLRLSYSVVGVSRQMTIQTEAAGCGGSPVGNHSKCNVLYRRRLNLCALLFSTATAIYASFHLVRKNG